MQDQKKPTHYPFGFQRNLRPVQLNGRPGRSDFFEIKLAAKRRRQKLARNVKVAFLVFFMFWILLFS